MAGEIVSQGSIPGGAEYANWSWYDGAQVPSALPSSPGFRQANMPPPNASMMPGFAEKGNQNAGNTGVMPMSGINFGNNPLMNIFGNMAVKGLFGNIRPLDRQEGNMLDVHEQRDRFDQLMKRKSDALPEVKNWGKLGDNPVFKEAYDIFLNPAGSSEQAFGSIMGSMGTAFGGNITNQTNKSIEAVKEMNEKFKNPFGGRDWNASYGQTNEELIENEDALARRGIMGHSKERFASSVGKKGSNSADLLKEGAKLKQEAGELFGKGKGMDELLGNLSQMADISGMDEGKMTDIINRIQATAKVVDVGNKAMTEYATLFNAIAKSMGQEGGTSTIKQALATSIAGNVSNQIAKEHGDSVLSDTDRAQSAAASLSLSTSNSSSLKRISAFGSLYAELAESQKRSIKMKDGSSVADQIDQMKKAASSGDLDGANKIMDKLQYETKSNPYIDSSKITMRAATLTKNQRDKAQTVFDTNTLEISGQGTQLMERTADILSRVMPASDVAAAGGIKGLKNIEENLKSLDGAIDGEKVREKINEMPEYNHLSQKQKDDLGTSFAQNASVILTHQAQGEALQGDQLNQAWMSGHKDYIARMQAKNNKVDLLAPTIGEIRDTTGEINRPYGFKDIIDDAAAVTAEMDKKGPDRSIKAWGEALKTVGRNASGAEELANLDAMVLKLTSDKDGKGGFGLDKVSGKAAKVYEDALKANGGDKKAAGEKAKDYLKDIEDKAKEGLKTSGSTSSTKEMKVETLHVAKLDVAGDKLGNIGSNISFANIATVNHKIGSPDTTGTMEERWHNSNGSDYTKSIEQIIDHLDHIKSNTKTDAYAVDYTPKAPGKQT